MEGLRGRRGRGRWWGRRVLRALWLLLIGLVLIWAVATLNPLDILGRLLPPTATDREVAALLVAQHRAHQRLRDLTDAHKTDSITAAQLRGRARSASSRADAAGLVADSLEREVAAARARGDTATMVPGLEHQVANLKVQVVNLIAARAADSARADLWEHRAYLWRDEVTDSLGPLNESLAKQLKQSRREVHKLKAVSLALAVLAGVQALQH